MSTNSNNLWYCSHIWFSWNWIFIQKNIKQRITYDSIYGCPFYLFFGA